MGLQKPQKLFLFLVKSSVILGVIRRNLYLVDEAHLRVIAPGKHSSFQKNVAAISSRWQHCLRFDRSQIFTPERNT